MGFKTGKIIKHEGFEPLDLNEGNVQAIFNRCLATDGTTEKVSSILYYREFGYETDDFGVSFDKSALSANWKNIKYLYGQLKPIHENQPILTFDNLVKTYQNTVWTSDRAVLKQLLYLGSSDESNDLYILNPFFAEVNGTTLRATSTIAPTLSPKDPNFPAWWEAHKAEWEE